MERLRRCWTDQEFERRINEPGPGGIAALALACEHGHGM